MCGRCVDRPDLVPFPFGSGASVGPASKRLHPLISLA